MAAPNRYYGVAPTQQFLAEHVYPYTATTGQTTFPAVYSPDYSIDVYYNGSHLDPRTSYTAVDGASVVLTDAATAGASVVIIVRPRVAISDIYTKTETNALATNFYGVATGTGDAQVVTTTPSFAALLDGMEIKFRSVAANATTTPTLTFNGLAAKTIVKDTVTALAVGDLAVNAEVTVRYIASIDKLVLISYLRSVDSRVTTLQDNGWFRSITGSATFTRTTNNINLTGVVAALGLEVGDVIQISGSASNNLIMTVDVTTDANNIIPNQVHANGFGPLSLTPEGPVTCTIKLLCKWYSASISVGRKWVTVTGIRAGSTNYTNTTGRSFSIMVASTPTGSGANACTIYVDGTTVGVQGSGSGVVPSTTAIVTPGSTYSATVVGGLSCWVELR